MRPTTVVAAAALLALTACTGDNGSKPDTSATPTPTVTTASPSASTQEAARAKENLRAGLMGPHNAIVRLLRIRLTESQAACLADEMVDDLGVDKLRRYQILDRHLEMRRDVDPGPFQPQDADATAQAVTDCLDVGELLADQLATMQDLSDAQRQCLSDAVDSTVVREQLSLALQRRRGDLSKALRSDILQCLTQG